MTSPMGVYIVETVVALAAVAALAVLVLYGARRMGVGRSAGPMQIVGRLSLEPRRAIYLVRVVDQVLIIGSTERGLTKLGDIPAAAVSGEDVSTPGFGEVLQAALGRARALSEAAPPRGEATPPRGGAAVPPADAMPPTGAAPPAEASPSAGAARGARVAAAKDDEP